MKNVILLFYILSSLSLYAQAIPNDSLYLGQIPPGNTPKVFNLPVTMGLHPIERISIASDGKEIYYSEIDTYPPTNQRIKYFKYSDNKWQGPFNVFEGFNSPGLSSDDKIIYMTKNIGRIPFTYYSVKGDKGWRVPIKFLSSNNRAHFFQKTKFDNSYFSSNSSTTPPQNDICKLVTVNSDTLIENLGMPINTSANEMDFFISKDESFIVISRYGQGTDSDMYLSFKRTDGKWTNPKKFDDQINTPAWEYAPVISNDNKYLFFTRGGNSMDSYCIYWVKIDNIIESLRHTNFIPYLNIPIPDQSAKVNMAFNFGIPDNTFIDDDGNNTLTYSVTLSDGNPLPAWISFDAAKCTFSGTPKEVGAISIKITAADASKAYVSCLFSINVIKEN